MKRFRKYSLQIAAAAIVAVVLTLAAPRAVHAVTAALVTVTNTASNPVVAQSVNQLTSQNVMLQASADVGSFKTFHQKLTDGTFPSVFVVPSGQSFVVTGIEILPTLPGGFSTPVGGSTDSVEILDALSLNVRIQMLVPFGETKHYEYASGLVFTAGQTVLMHSDVSSASLVTIYIFGYLTSN